MKLKTTITKLVISLVFFLFITSSAHSQNNCSPSFTNGCFSWQSQSITLDSIHWTVDPYYCDISDYTAMSTTLDAGSSYLMQVLNGNWCGCGVWIDFDLDQVFDTTENLFHAYSGNETNEYSFNITIPANTPSGAYRMRVIAGWGSDCYNPGTNGYGPCGLYQYGNFDDFTIHVAGVGTGSAELSSVFPAIEVNPNPATSTITVSLNDAHSGVLQLTNFIGQVIYKVDVREENEVIDVSGLPDGVYILHYDNGILRQSMKFIKE